jgi:hypothetical protein
MNGTALDRNFKQNKTVNSEEGREQACPYSERSNWTGPIDVSKKKLAQMQ